MYNSLIETILEVLPEFEKFCNKELKHDVHIQVKEDRVLIYGKERSGYKEFLIKIIFLHDCKGCIAIRSYDCYTLTVLTLIPLIEKYLGIKLYSVDYSLLSSLDYRLSKESGISIVTQILCVNTLCRDKCEELLWKV